MSHNRAMTAIVKAYWIVCLVAAIFVWGTVLAVGAYLLNHNLNRFFIVQGCVLGFLVFWLGLLAWRGRKITRPPVASRQPHQHVGDCKESDWKEVVDRADSA